MYFWESHFLFLVRISGAMYFINNIDNNLIRKRSVNSIKIDMIIFLVFFLNFLYMLLQEAVLLMMKMGMFL